MTSQIIYNIITEYSGLNISKKTRKRDYIQYRCIYYKLCVTHTKDVYTEISKLVNKDHATVTYNINKLYDVQIKNKVFLKRLTDIKKTLLIKAETIGYKLAVSDKIININEAIDILELKFLNDTESLKAKIRSLKYELKEKKRDNSLLQNTINDIYKLPKDKIEDLCLNRINPYLKMNTIKA